MQVPHQDAIDLLTLIEQDAGPGRGRGRWWMFHCPFPGHARGDMKPSLAVTPDNGRWHCFTCGRSGDAIGWLMKYRGLDFREASSRLGDNRIAYPRQKKLGTESQRHSPIIDIWQKRGIDFVSEAEANLWSSTGQSALKYLHKRGLTDTTIQRYRLGLCPEDHREPAEDWGFGHGNETIWLPRGITIPYICRNALFGINVRRARNDPKYVKVKGSRAGLFGAENLIAADIGLLCEGEFDCMLADQEIGDAIGVATLGSASQRLDLAKWGPYLMRLQMILVAYDSDSAGEQAVEAITILGNKLKPILLPDGEWKDVTDYFLAGGDLWAWIKGHITNLSITMDFSLINSLEALGGVVSSIAKNGSKVSHSKDLRIERGS